MKSTERLKRQKIGEAIRSYEEQGYRVVTEPTAADLPRFLARFRPDLVAYGDDETVVIEVASRESLAKGERLSELAAVLEDREAWRFEVIYVNPLPAAREVTLGESHTSLHEVRKLIDDAIALAHLRRASGAVLLAAAAAEALVRRLARRLSKHPSGDSPLALLKTVYSSGPLHEAHYQAFRQLFELRNRVVHSAHGRSPGDIVSLVDSVDELLRWEETRSGLERRFQQKSDFFDSVAQELIRTAHESDFERFIPIDSGGGELLHESADEIEVNRIKVGEVQDAADSAIGLDVSAAVRVTVSFLIDHDYVGEVEDVNFEVQDYNAVEGLASATTTRDMAINYTCWFRLDDLELLEAELISAASR